MALSQNGLEPTMALSQHGLERTWRRDVRVGNCCCGAFPLLPNHYHHTLSPTPHTHARTRAIFSGRTPTPLVRVERAKRGKDSGQTDSTTPSNWHDILWKQALEANPAVQIIRHDVDCERVAGQQPLVTGAISWSSWNATIGLVSRFSATTGSIQPMQW